MEKFAVQNEYLSVLKYKKAQKRLGKSGIRTHDPNFTKIYFIKMGFSSPILMPKTQDCVD